MIDDVKKYFDVIGAPLQDNNGIIDGPNTVLIVKKVKFTKLPFRFGNIYDFQCSYTPLTTLEGFPHTVKNTAFTLNYKITNLIESPKTVTGLFNCSANKLTSLAGSPNTIGGNFECKANELKSLVGGPKEVRGHYECSGNPLTSLDGLPDSAGFILLNWIENLPMLSLLKYDFNVLDNETFRGIMLKYRGQKPLRQAIIKCQKELIDAGYEGNAKL